jgi:glucokinase
MKRIGAVDIGGSKMAIGIVREDGTILDRRECVTLPERGFIDAMTRIESMLREMMATAGPIDGIGVGCPGPLSPLTGTLLEVYATGLEGVQPDCEPGVELWRVGRRGK